MLAVVHDQPVVSERPGKAAEPGSLLEQCDPCPGVSAGERRRYTGQAASYDSDPGRPPRHSCYRRSRRRPRQCRKRDCRFLPGRKAYSASQHARRLGPDSVEQAVVNAGHGPCAGPAPGVEQGK